MGRRRAAGRGRGGSGGNGRGDSRAASTASHASAVASGSRGTAARDLVRLADSSLAQDRYDEAAKYCQEALRIEPNNAAALSGLGRTFVALDRYDEAHVCFRSILESNPDSPDAHAGMGDLCMRLSEFERAVEAYDRAIAACPTKRDAHRGRGEALKNLGNLKAAAKSLATAMRCGGEDATSMWLLGECLFVLDRPRDAMRCFSRVRSLSTDMAAVALHNVAGCLAVLGRHDEAIVAYQKALDHDEDDWDSALGIASSLAAMGRNDAAMVDIDQLADNGPDHIAVEALLCKSRILDAEGRGDEAIEACDRIVEIDALNTEALLRKGRILARSGRRLAALSCIATARCGNPHHKNAARDAIVVTRALERAGGLPWMWKGVDGNSNGSGGGRSKRGNGRGRNGRRGGGGGGAHAKNGAAGGRAAKGAEMAETDGGRRGRRRG